MAQTMRKSLGTTVLAWLASAGLLWAQSPGTAIPLSSLPTDTTLVAIAAWRTTPTGTTPTDTLQADTYGRFQESKMDSAGVHWLRLALYNDLDSKQRKVLTTPYGNDEVEVYISTDAGRSWQHERLGAMISYWQVPYRHSNLLLPIDLAAGKETLLLIKIQEGYFGAVDPGLRLIDEESLKANFWAQYANSFEGVYLSVFILGAVLAIFLFVAFLYIMTRDRLYLFYGLYLGGVGLYFCAKTDSLFFIGYFVSGFPKLSSLLNEPLQMLYTALYIRFSMGLLRVANFDPGLDRFLSVFWKALIAYAIVLAVVTGLVWNREFELKALAFDRVVLLLFNVVMLFRVIQKNRSPLLSYFLVGNLFFLYGRYFVYSG